MLNLPLNPASCEVGEASGSKKALIGPRRNRVEKLSQEGLGEVYKEERKEDMETRRKGGRKF